MKKKFLPSSHAVFDSSQNLFITMALETHEKSSSKCISLMGFYLHESRIASAKYKFSVESALKLESNFLWKLIQWLKRVNVSSSRVNFTRWRDGKMFYLQTFFYVEQFLNLFFFLRSKKKRRKKASQLWKWKLPVELIQLWSFCSYRYITQEKKKSKIRRRGILFFSLTALYLSLSHKYPHKNIRNKKLSRKTVWKNIWTKKN